MMVAVMLFLTGGSTQVYGQEACSFVGGFAELRKLVGEQKVGGCLENEHFNVDNGNAEQRTVGGLLVWRKIDNFTAFTDGGTTWVNGPNGLQNRPNNERLAWELDPVVTASTPPSPTPKPLPTLPVASPLSAAPVTAPRVIADGGTIASPNYASQPGTRNAVPPPPVASTASAATAATPTPSSTPAGVTAAASAAGASTAGASTVPPPPPPASNTVAAVAAAPTAVTATPTKTSTPRAVTAKFTERPDDADTGNDVQFEVETNAKKGTCFLAVTYRNTSEANLGAKEVDDGKCEWKFNLAADTKTGKAKAVVTVVGDSGTTTVEDTFQVKKGDTVYAGSLDVEVDPLDMPDDVDLGEELKIGVDTNLKRKGSCTLTMTWPKVGPVNGESQMPDDSGKCSWNVKVPTTVPAKSTASLTVTVYKDSGTYRTLTREFKVAK